MANYANDEGYAWDNIFRLYNCIADSFIEKGFNICVSFAKINHPITVFDSGILYDYFLFNPIKISVKSLFNLYQNIKSHNVRYVYFTDLKPIQWLFPLLRLWGVRKIIVHCRVSVPSPYPVKPEIGVRKALKTAINRKRFFTADAVYAVSDFVKNRLVKKHCFPDERIHKILNGIDIQKFNCKELPLNRPIVSIFSCSRASKYKGTHILIEAVHLVKTKYGLNDFLVEFAGNGPDLNEFKSMVKTYELSNHFKFLGKLNDTKVKTCSADIIVVPSIWGDACPSTVMEALAAGKALITTIAGGIPEIVGDPQNAVLLPPHNADSLARALAEQIISGEKRQLLGIRARQRAENALKEVTYHDAVIRQLQSDIFIKPSPAD